MKKKLSVLLGGVTTVFTAALASCQLHVQVNPQGFYDLDTTEFDSVVAYQSQVDYQNLYLTRTDIKGERTRLPVTEEMFTTAIDTSSVGEKEAVIFYDSNTYTLDYTVKYKVEFTAGEEVISEQLVLAPEEIEMPEAPQKAGSYFFSWNDVLPETITGNLCFSAIFIEAPVAAVQAEYGDLLSSVKLPSNAYGSWQFVESGAQAVGSVGLHEMQIQFILNDGKNTVLATDTVSLKVNKKTLEFIDTVTEFEYDGSVRTPLYRFDGAEVSDVNVMYIPYYRDDAVNAGRYDFAILINDENYQGQWEGSFVIKKKYVKVSVVGEYEISVDETMPEVCYTVVDKNGAELSEELLALMGVEVLTPKMTGAGIYDIDLKISNSNFNVEVQKGILKVNKVTLDIAPQIVKDAEIIYGDPLAGVAFESVPQGVWSWKDESLTISTPTTFTATAVFTPTYANYYETMEKEVVLSVKKRKVTITVTENEFTYDGTEKRVEYTVTGILAGDENAYTVLGADAHTEVKLNDKGEVVAYTGMTLTVDSARYEGSCSGVSLLIKQASCVDFEGVQSQIQAAVWRAVPVLKLEDITLPEGYAWVNGGVTLDVGENQSFEVVFTPKSNNYKTETASLLVSVLKAEGKIFAADKSFTYDKNHAYALGVSANHTEEALIYAYELNGVTVDGVTDAGDYTVTVTLPESKHYTAASAEIKVRVNAVENTDEINAQSATYLDKLGKFALPKNENGVWSWQEGADALVGAAGTQTHIAVFTPHDTTNYLAREVEVTFTVAKFGVAVPTVVSKPYTGETLTAVLQASTLYTVTENAGGIHVGKYPVKLKLADENYTWNDGVTALERTLEFSITKADNEWAQTPALSKTNWIFGSTGATVTAKAKFGEVVLVYKDAEGNEWTEMPEDAGTYTAVFKVVGNDNYEGLDEQIRSFTISQQAVNAPVLTTASVVYDGEKHTATVAAKPYYTVDASAATDVTAVGDYTVTVTLTDDNYKWSSTDEQSITLTFSITKASNGWTTAPAIEGWKYNQTASVWSASASFGTVSLVYTGTTNAGVAYNSATAPTEAGSYKAIFSVEGTVNYDGITATEVAFTVERADNEWTSAPAIEGWEYNQTAKEWSATALYGTVSVIYTGTTNAGVAYNSENAPTEAGSYKAIFAIETDNNYQGITATEVAFTVEKADNEWTSAPAIANWKYNQTASAWSAKALYGTVSVIYTGTTNAGVAYNSENAPTEAGSYKAIFSVEGTGNYDGITATEVAFTVEKADNAWTSAPAIEGWKYNQTASAWSAKALYGTVSVIYTGTTNAGVAYNGATAPTEAGAYKAIFTVATDNNYQGITATEVAFTVEKAIVTEPIIEGKAYTGVTLTADVPADARYQVTENDGGKTKGDYDVVLKLTDKHNYKWLTTDEESVTLTFSVTNTTNAWKTKPSLSANNWVYSTTAATVDLGEANFGTATVIYKDSNGATHTQMPETVGKYTAIFKVAGTNDYTEISHSIDFEIIKASNGWTSAPAIEGWKYNQTASVWSATASFGTVSVVYTGTTNAGVAYNSENAPTEAGSYKAVFTVEGTVNYDGIAATEVVFTVERADNEWTSAPAIEGWEYNQTAKEWSATALYGTVSVIYTGTTNAGVAYNSENVPTEAGSYKAIFAIETDNNYQGITATEVAFTVEKADNEWTSAPAIANWKYNQTASAWSATAKFGTVSVVYTGTTNAGVAYNSENAPTEAGSYKAIFSVEGTGNYDGITATEVAFTVEKAIVTTPTLASKPYTGKTLTAAISDTADYTVTKNAGGITVGEYDVVLALTDSNNHKWSTADTASVTLKFKVTAATDNAWTAEPSLSKNTWTYNTAAATIVMGKATYCDISVRYEGTTAAGVAYSSATMPIEAGSYKAIFYTAESGNYNAVAEKTLTFKIEQAQVTVPTLASKAYTGNTLTADVVASEYYTVTTNAGGVTVGGYSVVLNLKNANYKWNDGTSGLTKTLTFSITKATNAWTTTPSFSKQTWTYGEASGVLTAASKFGSYAVTYTGTTAAGTAYNSTTMPTEAGSYQAVVSVPTNGNYTDVESHTFALTISVASVTKPTQTATETTYDGNTYTTVQNSTMSAYYTLSGDVTVSAVGDYTVTASLKNRNSSTWADGSTGDITFTFSIKKAAAEITFSIAADKWVYLEKTAAEIQALITLQDNLGNIAVLYCDTDHNFSNPKTISGVNDIPTNAGTYYFKAVIAGTDNYDGAETSVLAFTIEKANVNFTASYSGSGYENNSAYINSATYSHTHATVANTTVAGLASFSVVKGQVIGANGTAGTVNVTATFTPTDTANYNVATITVPLSVITVATAGTDAYGSLESALEKVTSGTITITAGLQDMIIADNCTIPSGVTVNIPHLGGTNTSGAQASAMNSSGTATLYTATSNDGKGGAPVYVGLDGMTLETEIKILAGKKLTNNGTLQIAGELSGANGGAKYAGHTAGKYAKLSMEAGAILENNGKINCYGIIAETTVNNQSKILNNNGGSIYMPFVVRDFRGGSMMYGINQGLRVKVGTIFGFIPKYEYYDKEICPFNQFEFRNITVAMDIAYGGSVYGWANLYAGDQQNNKTVAMIGNTDTSSVTNTAFFIQAQNGATVHTKYTPCTFAADGITPSWTDGDTVAEGIMSIEIDGKGGGAKLNSINLKVSTTLGSANMNTSDYFFALTWRWDITLKNGNFSMPNQYKMYAGAKLTVENGATLTVGRLNIYKHEGDWTDRATNQETGYGEGVPDTLYINRGDAKLTVKTGGHLIVTKAIGGDVYVNGGRVTTDGAATTLTTYEALRVTGSSLTAAMTEVDEITKTYNPITV